MKRPLHYLCFIIFLIVSCAKSPDNTQQANVAPPSKVFVPVTIFGSPGNWGGAICAWGFIMIREDSNSIVYHSPILPVGVSIPSIPTSVKLQYHDTTGPITNCWRHIVVDSIKF